MLPTFKKGIKKTCSNCGKPIEQNRYNGGQRYCRACHAANMRLHRPKYSELSEEQKKRNIARSYAREYIKRGHIKRAGCIVCGQPAQMHHPNYDKPLEIVWLCRKHHLELHHYGNLNSTGPVNSVAVPV